MTNMLIQILPMMLLQSCYAIFIYNVAKRMENSPTLSVVLTIIPIFGLFYFFYFFFYKVFKVMFDRLEILELNKSN